MEEDSPATHSPIASAIPLGSPQTDDPPSPEKTPQTQQPSRNPRRLPPPCWSQDETVALIESYRDKWYALRRGNLKAPHWQEVADDVSRRCPDSTPPKTAVQCRHKMEKLRKRYRAELQRARSLPVSRFISSWVHFKHMDAMEKGPAGAKPAQVDSEEDNDDLDDEDDDDELFEGIAPNPRSIHGLYGNGRGYPTSGTAKSVRIKIPNAVSIAQPGNDYRKIGNNFNSAARNVNPIAKYGKFVGDGVYGSKVGSREASETTTIGKRERDPVEEMVDAIKGLGDGFVRVERLKMEMARDMEGLRMEMEMKRTEMILESQQRILDAFARAVSDQQKKKRRRIMADAEEDN